MLITRRSDYALRICRVLQDNKIHNVTDICAREDVPKAFAYKILREMEEAGMIRSERGNRGGYYLKMSLDELTLYDVIQVMEDDVAMLHCMKESCRCNERDNPCKVHREIARIQGILEKELRKNTIGEILTAD